MMAPRVSTLPALRASTRHALAATIIATLAALFFATPIAAQDTVPGGFVETTSSIQVRSRVTPVLPTRGAFTFPAPYNTVGVRDRRA
jgi:hypothetical protein